MSAEATCMLSMSSERPVSDLRTDRVEKVVSPVVHREHCTGLSNNKVNPMS